MRFTTQVPASCYVTISTEADSLEEALSNFKKGDYEVDDVGSPDIEGCSDLDEADLTQEDD